MAERNLGIRLSLQDADVVKRGLQALGKEGQDALRRIEQGSKPASDGLLALNKVSGDLRGRLDDLGGRAGIFGNVLSGLGAGGAAAAIGIGAAIAALGILYTKGKEALAFADNIGDVADKLHITAEQLQEIRFAFTGLVEPQQVDAGLTTFTRNLGLAEAGNKKALISFQALHMELKNGNGQYKTNAEALSEVIDRVAALKSPEEQLAITTKLFGDEMAAGLPALRQGNQFFKERADQLRSMGGLISNDDIARAGQFQQVLDDLSVVVKAQLTQGFLTAAPQIVAFTRLVGENLPKIVSGAAGVVKFLADNLTTLAEIAATTAGVIAGGLIGSALGPLGTILGALIGGFAGMKVAVDNLEGSQRTYNDLMDKAKRVTDELTAASGERKKALEAEQRNLLALAEAELQRADAALQAKQAEYQATVDQATQGFDAGGGALAPLVPGIDLAEAQQKRDALAKGILQLRATAGLYNDGGRPAIPDRQDATTGGIAPTVYPGTLGSLASDGAGKKDTTGATFADQLKDLQSSLALQRQLNAAYLDGGAAVAKITRELELQQKINAISAKYTPQQRQQIEDALRQQQAEQLRGKTLEKASDLQDQVALAQKEAELAGETEEVRNRELAIFKAKIDLQKQGVDLSSEEAQRVLQNTAKLADTNSAIAKQKDLYSELGDLAGGAFDRIGQAATEFAVDSGQAAVQFQQVWAGAISEVEQAVFRLAVLNPLKNALGLNDGKTLPTLGDVGGLLGKGFSWLSGLLGGGSSIYPGSTTVGPGGLLGHNAVGNVYDWTGKVHAYARGGIVDQPMVFPFARGVGLMGEAGPEAIMPLTRLPNGNLGVAANQNGGDDRVSVVINNNTGEKVTTKESRDGRGARRLEVAVGEMWAQEAARPGSTTQRGVGQALQGPKRR